MTRHRRFSPDEFDELEYQRDSDCVYSWDAALRLIDRYPWHRLYALTVHPQFKARVWTAVQLRVARDERPDHHALERWRELCAEKLKVSRRKLGPIRGEQRVAFPIIDYDRFQSHPKFRKSHDLKRILYSKTSEDWVTWTVFGLLARYAPTTWWFDLVKLARVENPRLIPPPGWDEIPEVRLWQCVPSPAGYETASRVRMQRSNNEAWKERSRDLRPVEGDSEIDVILRNRALSVFAEAKLDSDVSSSTKYDPYRNQIIRNIDCVLDRAEGRVPMFWMLVRDASKERSYTQLFSHYRASPNALVRELPHHDPETVTGLAGNLTLLLWKDIIARVAEVSVGDDEQIASIKNELSIRCLLPR
jgi:hypothetical protein